MATTGDRRSGPVKGPLIGAQISTAGGFAPVPERAAAIGAEAVQVFSSNPRTWQARLPGPQEVEALVRGLRSRRLPLFLHTIYLINLASPDVELRRRSAEAVAQALATGASTGAVGVVTHIGSHKGQGFETGCRLVVDSLRAALDMASGAGTRPGREPALPRLLLETAVGTGTVIGGRLEELAAVLEELPEAGLCLDTAHMFAAGYPVHEARGLDEVADRLRGLDLLRRVDLVHLNDSLAPFGCDRDLHANPGDGQIGWEGLARIVRHPALVHIPLVLEVPGADGRGPDLASVAAVKRMRAGLPAPRAVKPRQPAAPAPLGEPAPGA